MAFDIEDELPNRESARQFYQKYEPREVLGKGLSSVVRKCVDKATGKEYACKIMEFNDDSVGEREATLREIQILKLVGGHPNIIDIIASFETPNCVFIVMELCPYGELFDYLTKVVRLSEKRTRQIMASILAGVLHLHSHHVVHRDLKPENILMDATMNVKITDLGFAVQISENECLYDLFGTPGYMAPELLRCTQNEYMPGYGLPVDLWACGVILYTLLSGLPPFWHRKQHLMFRMIMEGHYTMIGSEWDDVSENAKDLIRHLLIVNPAERYTAAQALEHPFFINERTRRKDFMAKRALKAHLILVWSIHRLRTLHYRPQPIRGKELLENPYRFKSYRKMIDSTAFILYGHWIKKDEHQNQNRATLFQTEEKCDLVRYERRLIDRQDSKLISLQRQKEFDNVRN
jgi:phosphorylase kinase gamma subunit